MKLFKPGIQYPRDSYGGEFIELVGPVVATERITDDLVRVDVDTPKGRFRCYWNGPGEPKQESRATVRIYNSGGGWYPDDRVTGWTSAAEVR